MDVKGALLVCAVAAPALCRADAADAEHQIQRALIERDRQAAEFSHPQLRDMPRPSRAAPPRPDQRELRARERDAYLLEVSPPPVAPPSSPALPLPSSIPGGSAHGVDPVPVQGAGG